MGECHLECSSSRNETRIEEDITNNVKGVLIMYLIIIMIIKADCR